MQRLAETVTFPKSGSAAASNISARIPLQSAARTSLADSFSPGEAIAPCGRQGKESSKKWKKVAKTFEKPLAKGKKR